MRRVAGRVVFRADSGLGVGDGHLMRCLALAEALVRQGQQPCLATADPTSRAAGLWRSAGLEVVASDLVPGTVEDAAGTLRLADEAGAAWLIIDSYAFGPESWGVFARGRTRIVRFDDEALVDLPCAAVINQNAGAERLGDRYRHAVQHFLGPAFACIRGAIRSARRSGGGGVLVCFGGSVPASAALPVAEAVAVAVEAPVILIVPDAASVAPGGSRVRLLPSTDIAPYLAAADLFVGGAGVMSLEAAMMGVPMVLLPVADNQRRGAESMARAGAAVTVSSAEAAAEAARLLLGDPGETARMSRQGRELVDGRGPERILAALEGSVWRETPAGLA